MKGCVIFLLFMGINFKVLGVLLPWSDDTRDTAICHTFRSAKESRYVPYFETYRSRFGIGLHRIQTRVNYKTEYHTTWYNTERCCDGFELDGVFCKPICSRGCTHGSCIKPDTCSCSEGYAVIMDEQTGNDTCKPICSNTCIRGDCMYPQVCLCHEGYWIDSDGFTCQPYCPETCTRSNGHCSVPNVCSCPHGFELSHNSSVCEPTCDQPCIHGTCIAPNVCRCEIHYQIQPGEDPFTCQPICDDHCYFGTCVAPNSCVCKSGYSSLNASHCEPHCSKACIKGTCVAPEICSCDPGYGWLESTEHVCLPICDEACINGECIAPNVCSCHKGYKFVYDDSLGGRLCSPICHDSCKLHGRCVGPNNCTCDHGYEQQLRGSDDVVCEPVCQFNCTNGVCIGPNECQCNEGFQLMVNESTSICQPFCVSCPVNSKCSLPNVCDCEHGYEKMTMNSSCQAVCRDGCENGDCTAPDVCICHEGFIKSMNDSECIPDCSLMPCGKNGTCVASNVCTCDEGYGIMNETNSTTVCQPICINGCSNGICIAPNTCQCHGEFVKNNDSNQQNICIKECERDCNNHGICFKDETSCLCNFGWTGWDCEEPTFCILTMESNDKKTERIAKIHEANNTVTVAFDKAPECRRCDIELENTTLCFRIFKNSNSTGKPVIACLLSTALPCYTLKQSSALSNVSKIAGSTIFGVLIIVTAFTIRFFIIRKRRENKMRCRVIVQPSSLGGLIASESLLGSDDADYL